MVGLPAASVAVNTTGVVPKGYTELDGAVEVKVTGPGQLSLTIGAVKVTAVEQMPGATVTVRLAGQRMLGATMSGLHCANKLSCCTISRVSNSSPLLKGSCQFW